MTDKTLPTLVSVIEMAYHNTVQGQASPAELVGVSITLLLKRGSTISMETMGVSKDVDIQENEQA